VYQDRELAAKRAIDQRRAAIEKVRRELSSRLETIKLQEINRLIRPPDSHGARNPANPAVILTATLEGDQLVLPVTRPALRKIPPRISRGIARRERSRSSSIRTMAQLPPRIGWLWPPRGESREAGGAPRACADSL
jgi:hypothetical protein